MPPNAQHPPLVTALRAIYCDNRKCSRTYPVGKARLVPGAVVSFSCPNCGFRTVKAG